VGRVLYPGTVALPVEQLARLGDGVTWTATPAAADQLWAVTAMHPARGSAEIACARHAEPLPDVVIDQMVSLSAGEKARARLGRMPIAVRVRMQPQHVLRDRKHLLYWLRALMQLDGAIAVDTESTLLWSREMLDDELAHDADLDVESLYAIHAVYQPADPSRVTWLHTHGLGGLRAFDVDVLQPSPVIVANCADIFRPIAFAALEDRVQIDTDRFTVAHPGGDVRLVPADRFQAEAAPEHAALRDPQGHSGRRAVLCEPAGGLFGLFRSRPRPSRFLSEVDSEGFVSGLSSAATALMAERAQRTLTVFAGLIEEFASLQLPAVVKLGYEIDGGGPDEREHLWFEVHQLMGDTVDATLANTPHRVSALQAGQRGRHALSRLTDWTIMSPEGPMTPRNINAARRLRERRVGFQDYRSPGIQD
jgi:Protein of unknown function (DUF4026)/Uncharacterized protein conserved in bacteria (DUF2314)